MNLVYHFLGKNITSIYVHIKHLKKNETIYLEIR